MPISGCVPDPFGRAAKRAAQGARGHGTGHADFALAADLGKRDADVRLAEDAGRRGGEQEIDDAPICRAVHKAPVALQPGRHDAGGAMGGRRDDAPIARVVLADRQRVAVDPVQHLQGVAQRLLWRGDQGLAQAGGASLDLEPARRNAFDGTAAQHAGLHDLPDMQQHGVGCFVLDSRFAEFSALNLSFDGVTPISSRRRWQYRPFIAAGDVRLSGIPLLRYRSPECCHSGVGIHGLAAPRSDPEQSTQCRWVQRGSAYRKQRQARRRHIRTARLFPGIGCSGPPCPATAHCMRRHRCRPSAGTTCRGSTPDVPISVRQRIRWCSRCLPTPATEFAPVLSGCGMPARQCVRRGGAAGLYMDGRDAKGGTVPDATDAQGGPLRCRTERPSPANALRATQIGTAH
jgi:hypothetical protein